MADPNAPDDDYDAGLEGNLRQVSDEAWLVAHRQLIASGAIPVEEAAYLYDPARDPHTVAVDDLTVDRDPEEPADG